jgi:hypothetical protein
MLLSGTAKHRKRPPPVHHMIRMVQELYAPGPHRAKKNRFTWTQTTGRKPVGGYQEIVHMACA